MSKDFDKRDCSGSSNGFGFDASETREIFLKAVEKNHGSLLADIFELIREEASKGRAECWLLKYNRSPFPTLNKYGISIMNYLQNRGYKINYSKDSSGQIRTIVVSWPNPSFGSVEKFR